MSNLLNDYVFKYQLKLTDRDKFCDSLDKPVTEQIEPYLGMTEADHEKIVALHTAYRTAFSKMNHYGARIRGTDGFFKGAIGTVVRPYPNDYNLSVYVQWDKDGAMLPPMIMNSCDLDRILVPGDAEWNGMTTWEGKSDWHKDMETKDIGK